MLKKVLYSLIIVFILTLGTFILLNEYFFPIVAILGILFFLLGIYFIYLTKKSKKKKKFFLYLTGISAALIFPSVILHNVLYALGILTENTMVLKAFFEFLHGTFFIIAVMIAPITFVIGVIGSLVERKKK